MTTPEAPLARRSRCDTVVEYPGLDGDPVYAHRHCEGLHVP